MDWNKLHESSHDDCNGDNCLVFSTEDLCSHMDSDHNYYAACRNLLHKDANDKGRGLLGGLLHDMPAHAVDDWDLGHLLNECVHQSVGEGRIKAKNRIIEALDTLRNVNSKKVEQGERLA